MRAWRRVWRRSGDGLWRALWVLKEEEISPDKTGRSDVTGSYRADSQTQVSDPS